MNKEQIEALKAQVEQLRNSYKELCGAINDLDDCEDGADEAEEAAGKVFAVMQHGWGVISKTPDQCLAEIKAQAVEDFCASEHGLALDQCPTTDDCSEDLVIGWKAGNIDCRMAGRKYANQLRQQAGVQK